MGTQLTCSTFFHKKLILSWCKTKAICDTQNAHEGKRGGGNPKLLFETKIFFVCVFDEIFTTGYCQ